MRTLRMKVRIDSVIEQAAALIEAREMFYDERVRRGYKSHDCCWLDREPELKLAYDAMKEEEDKLWLLADVLEIRFEDLYYAGRVLRKYWRMGWQMNLTTMYELVHMLKVGSDYDHALHKDGIYGMYHEAGVARLEKRNHDGYYPCYHRYLKRCMYHGELPWDFFEWKSVVDAPEELLRY